MTQAPWVHAGRLAMALAAMSAAAGLSGACAAHRQAAAAAAPKSSGIDCGFTAPTSCWTLGPRFPTADSLPADSAIRAPAPRVLVDASK